MRRSREGINFFDTANVYGRHLGVGSTERIIGDWFAKGGGRGRRSCSPPRSTGRWRSGRTSHACRSSRSAARARGRCKRLQTDYIDLYQMHHIDRNAWWNEIWEAMDQLKSEGKILYVGSSNFAGWHIARANEIASKWHTVGLATEQSLYNLTERTLELEVIPAVAGVRHGPDRLEPARGRLAGGGAQEGRRRVAAPPNICRTRSTRTATGWSATRRSAPTWARGRRMSRWRGSCISPAVTAPIIGPRTEEQLEGSFRALEVELDEDVLRRLDEIFPGPGGAAPEAYAW